MKTIATRLVGSGWWCCGVVALLTFASSNVTGDSWSHGYPVAAATIANAGDGVDKDTPDTVMQAGKNGTDGLNAYLGVLRDAQAVSAHMARDKEHSAKVLELARKNDRLGMAALFRRDAPSSQIEITEIKDFTVTYITKAADGKTTVVCVSTSGGCGGRNFVLLIP